MEPISNLNCDMHLHTRFSDGSATVDQMVETAIEKGLTKIAITDHMPLPYPNRYTMKPDRLLAYRDAVKKAQDKYSDRIQVLLGLEIEVVPSLAFWTDRIISLGWDWLIASVHTLEKNGTKSLINGTPREFDTALGQMFDNDIQALVQAYYRSMAAMVSMGVFQAVGHLDVIRKHMTSLFPGMETRPFYRDLVNQVLDRAFQAGVAVEINTGGMDHPSHDFYPHVKIVHQCADRGIPLVMSSDAHRPEQMCRYFDHVSDFLPRDSHMAPGAMAAAG